MINKPGTLLVVRKIQRNNSRTHWAHISPAPDINGIRGIFRIDIEKEKERPLERWATLGPIVNLPLGSAVLLVSLEKPGEYEAGESWIDSGRGNKIRMKALYGDKRIVGYLSNNQINKWFTFPHVWKNRSKKQKKEEKDSLDKKKAQ